MALAIKHAQAIRPAFQVCGMATEKQVLMRINSTKNIAKITKSMKMVSAAKMRAAQNRLERGRPFASWLTNIFGKPVQINLAESTTSERNQVNGKKNVYFVITSDRGLCGGCNSFVCKATRFEVSNCEKEGLESNIVVFGEKGRAQLRRTHSDRIVKNITDYRAIQTFAQASAMTECTLHGIDFDTMHVMYNRFHSAIAYFQTMRTMPNITKPESEKFFSQYEFEPDNQQEVLQDLQEFQLASSIYYGMIEGATSEESSRMTAMENATKNASELIQDLTLVYNKARQSRITTELIEIISGASSLDSEK